MGVVTFSIGSTNVLSYLQAGSLSCDHYLNQRPVLRCVLRVRDGDGYRPSPREQVEFTDDSEIVFGGIVFTINETDIINYRGREIQLDCVGYEVFADNTLFNGIISAGTLKSQVTAVAVVFSAHGITVDSFMANGPAMEEQTIPYATARGALDQLSKASGWNWKFDTSQHVTMEEPGTIPAPFSLSDANSTILSLEHKRSLANYVNDAWVKFGGSDARDVTDTFIGDGAEDTFELNYPVSVAPLIVTEDGVTYSLGGAGGWTYSATPTPRVIKSSPPANGDLIEVPFNAQFPAYTYVRDAEYVTYGPWTTIFEYPDIFDVEKAETAASWELARRVGVVRQLTATTAAPGLWPGMTVDVTASKRDLSSTEFLIQRIGIKHQTRLRNGEHFFFYQIEAMEGNQHQYNWHDTIRRISQAGGGAAGVAGGVSSGGGSTVVTVRGAYWGGSREVGNDSGTWHDVASWLTVPIDGTSGISHTVRVDQRTDNAGTSVQARIVKISGGTVMVTGTLSTSTSWTERLLTFTPSSGMNDYKLQATGSNSNAQVYAIGQSL